VSVHVTPVFARSLLTVAVNRWAMFTGSNAPPGAADTVIAGTVTFATANAEVLFTEVAVMVTAKLAAGGVVGAV
jgi:hypothetical protein